MRFARLLLPISILLSSAISASPAGASTPVGQLLPPFAAGSCAGNSEIQTGVETGTTPYAVPAGGGVITSWQTQTLGNAGTMKLKVFRSTGTPGEFLAVAEDGPRNILANTSPTFSGIRIPVQAGDLVGMRGSGVNCASHQAGKTAYKVQVFETIPDPPPGTKDTIQINGSETAIEMLANVEPDADNDGYGDETQDACLSNPLGHEAPCPTLPAPPDTRAPRITLNSKTTQGAKKAVVAIATADEDVTFKASGSVNVPGAGAFSLVPREAAGAANSKTSLSLGISKKARGKIAAALKKGKRVRASVHVVAKDAAGNTSNATQSITIAKSIAKKH